MDDRELIASSIAQVLGEVCDSRSLHHHVDKDDDLPGRLLARAAELGWLGIGVSEETGGLGLGEAGLALAAVELGRRLAPGPFIATLALAQALDEYAATPELRALVPGLISGAIGVALPARPGADLLFGDLAGEPSLTVLEEGGGAQVVAVTGAERVDGWDRTRRLWRVPAEQTVVGNLSAAASQRLSVLTSLLLAADSLGVMKGAFTLTVDYLKSREQFGVKIGSFQALKHRAADMAAAIELADCLVGQAVEAAQAGDEAAMFWSAACKAQVTDAAAYVTQDCLQLHGGIGFTWEYDCHLFLKRARLNQALAGANPALREAGFQRLAGALRTGAPILEIAR